MRPPRPTPSADRSRSKASSAPGLPNRALRGREDGDADHPVPVDVRPEVPPSRAESDRRTGDESVEMTIVSLRDPAARKIRAWLIASDGSRGQSDVEVEGETIRLDTKGVTPDGSANAPISTP